MSDEACEKRTEPQDTEVAKNREEDFSRKKATERAHRNARRGGSQKPDARSQKPEARSQKPEASSQKPEARGRKPEAGFSEEG